MVSSTARHLGQPLPAAELRVKGVALALGALVLPVGGPVVGEHGRELRDEGPLRVQRGEGVLRAGGPVHAAVLLAGAAHGGDASHGHVMGLHGGGEALQHQVERLHPHGDGGVDLARRGPHVHALADAILGAEVAVEVDLGLGDGLEVRVDDDGCGFRVSVWALCLRRGHGDAHGEVKVRLRSPTLELLRRQVKAQVQRPRVRAHCRQQSEAVYSSWYLFSRNKGREIGVGCK